MSKVQLRLYIETDDEGYTKERDVLKYVQDMFNQEYKGLEEDVKEVGNSIITYTSRLEHGW
tara:strand:+ start:529 stop:711 length:183 start_codon:yes stop_codon:yes gene_type:complete